MKFILIIMTLVFISSCAHKKTQDTKAGNSDNKMSNRFQVSIPEVTQSKQKERFIKKFLGKKQEIFVEFFYSNTGKYRIKVTLIPDSLLNLDNIKASLLIKNENNPGVISFANDGNGNLSGFGPYLAKGTELDLKIIFIKEKVENNFSFKI